MAEHLATELAAFARMFDARLASLMQGLVDGAASAGRRRLAAAMRHATLAGGKRIRPFLVFQTAMGVGRGERVDAAIAAGLAVELIHCYSLVHDDLPAMDDDDMRRGKPTVHVAYDDATAILVGDALQTLAFERLLAVRPAALAVALIGALAGASGEAGMVGGQMLDLDAEGRFDEHGPARPAAEWRPKALDLEAIAEVQSLKTGALIAAAVTMGALVGGLDPWDAPFVNLQAYAQHLGRAFQISDDLIDTLGDSATAGKAVAKDAGAGKATFVSALGVDGARMRLRDEIDHGIVALAEAGDYPLLAALLRSMQDRRT
jgi:farnesyl diphosphate synthase